MRFIELDLLRGFAIVWMVILHLFWDLDYYTVRPLNETAYYPNHIGVATLFFLLVGVGLAISSYNKTKKQIITRGLFIFSLGMVISVISFFIFPERPVIFGVLHMIGFSMILGAFFVRYEKFCLALSPIIVCIGFAYGSVFNIGPTLDYFPVFPWFGVALFGIYLGLNLYENGERQFWFPKVPDYKPIKLASWAGRHSLPIYLAHQPVIAGSLIFAKTYFPQLLMLFKF